MSHLLSAWISSDSSIAAHVEEEARRTLAAYQVQPNLLREHVGIEEEVLSGGYGHRQIHELVQNAADAILECESFGEVHLILTSEALYCANEGAPIDEHGVNAILNSHMSRKRGAQIGQFGIGFKSVLAISTSPQFFGRSGSFGFDGVWAASRIRDVLPSATNTPVLRLARSLNACDSAGDRHLSALAEWATTVIRLPRNLPRTEWLSQDFARFPAEFLLFSPHVKLLVLDDRITGQTRRIETSVQGSSVTIREAGQQSVWTVFRRDISVAALPVEARHDADRKTRERDVLPLLWAVPYDARRARGQFWAFFPTETETSLTGILNAPWKTNADRQNLLDGPFNRALLAQVVNVVVDSVGHLFRETDPGYLLDLLPVRATDAAGWADKALIEGLEPALRATRCMPSSSIELKLPGALRMRPATAISQAVDDFLFKQSDLPVDWVHHSVEKRERRAKAERIGVKEPALNLWLEDLVRPGAPGNSLAAVLLAAALHKELPPSQQELLRQARIVLTASGVLVSANHPGLHTLAKDTQDDGSAEIVVHSALADDENGRNALRVLRVAEDGGKAQLDALLNGYDVRWDRVWELLRGLESSEALNILSKHAARNPAHVRTRKGEFKPAADVLLPGPIIHENSECDRGVCVDVAFHHADLTLLHAVGVTAGPAAGSEGKVSRWFSDYLRSARDEYLSKLQGGSRPSEGYLSFGKTPTIGPLGPLMSLSEEGRAAMSHALLPFLVNEEPWVLRHNTRPASYPKVPYVAPVQWMLEKHGRLFTSLGIRPVHLAVGDALNDWRQILPVADISHAAVLALDLPQTLETLTDDQWNAALAEIRDVTDDALIGRFYAEAARSRPAPASLWCWKGSTQILHPTTEIHVASDDETVEAHRQSGVASLLVPGRDLLHVLVDRWGMQRAAGTVRYMEGATEAPLADVFPGLRRYLPESAWRTSMQPCEQLWFESVVAGAPSIPLTLARVGDRICYVQSLSPEDLLGRAAAEHGVELTREQVRDALNLVKQEERQRFISGVLATTDLCEKLMLLVSEERLFEGLPPGVQALLRERGCICHRSVAEAALAVFGVEALRRYTDALHAAGLEPPSRWSGSPRAQEFVDELGFPAEFAGFQSSRRDPTLDVDGPVDLKPLHDFQQEIGDRIVQFLQKPEPERALLSLPTGAGKTRVVVQAFANAMRSGTFTGTVVWVAQSDELCEQAVQSWAQVWRSLGSSQRLRISRLWGQTNNRVVDAGAPQVVVATFQSLVSRLRYPAYEWLRNAACVIIDEAHGSIAPSYTEILDQFGITARTTDRPLIGLTATPFRSAADPTETQWLVNRYGRQRFDHGVLPGDDPYPVLQARGILARVDQQVLEGASLTLSPTELADLNQFKRLPASAELRLGEIAPRNERIVESIKSLPVDWPVLLFATSVEQAHLMAALLSLEGITAKAISGETEAGPRRHYIEEFRRGKIRVLSNYNVLSTGFDAPALRALYIARPVFSPVLYQQMLGRGLRGPLNGGKERCLVVNVQDNIAQFGEQLAFRHFEYLWQEEV